MKKSKAVFPIILFLVSLADIFFEGASLFLIITTVLYAIWSLLEIVDIIRDK